jgi:hypothetical protein
MVPDMTYEYTAPLFDIALGDIVTIAGSHSYTVRAHAVWPTPIADLSGFVLLGELDMILGIPASGRPIDMYLPVTRFSVTSSVLQSVSEGAVRYWPPHMPSHGGVMAELLYRLLASTDRSDTGFIMYRSSEAVVFQRTTGLPYEHVQTSRMTRGSVEGPVERHTASFTPVPAYVPPSALYEKLTTR